MTPPVVPPVIVTDGSPTAQDAAAAAAARPAAGCPAVEVTLIHDAEEAGAVLAAVAAGTAAVVGPAPELPRPVWVRFVRALADVADVRRWETSGLDRLNGTQIRLLGAVADGESVRTAARAVGVSERSAHRYILEARDALGARSNVAAASLVAAALAQLLG